MKGRPRAKLDKERIEQLAAVGLTVSEIAVIEGVSKKTIDRRALKEVENGRQRLHASLKRKQVEVALAGNTTMLIWLGKQYLDQSDKVDNTHSFGDSLKSILTK